MLNTSEFCRTQEARQRAIAAETTLDNVRKVALVAAAVWEQEALIAFDREEHGVGDLSAEDAAIAEEFRLEEAEDGEASEEDVHPE